MLYRWFLMLQYALFPPRYGKRTLRSKLTGKRWRTTTLSGEEITLMGVGDNDSYTGEITSVSPLRLWLCYKEVDHVPLEKFTTRKVV